MESVERYAFSNAGLTEIFIGKGVKEFVECAFMGCSSLQKVIVSDLDAWCSAKFGSSFDNPLFFAHNLYLNGNLVTEVTFPKDLQNVSRFVFYNCHSIEKVVIPDNVVKLDDEVFFGCKNLKEVKLGEGLTEIGAQCFLGCTSLNNVVIPEKIVSISRGTFDTCSSLSNVTIGKGVQQINQYAFKDCASNLTITYEGSEEAWKCISKAGNWLGEGQKEVTMNYNGGGKSND